MRAWLARNRRDVLAVGAIAIAVAVTITSRLSFLGGGEIDWDEGVYWLSMRSMQAGHPLFLSVYSSQPPAFLLFSEPPWALLGGGIAAARAVMLSWGAIAVVAGSIVGWRLGDRVAAVAVAVTLAVDPLMVRQSLVLQADGPSTSLAVVAIAFGAVAISSDRKRWGTVAAALAGAALAIGVLTKLLDVDAIPPLIVVLAGRGRWRQLFVAAFAGGIIAAGAILLPLHDAWGQMWDQAVGLHLTSRSGSFGLTLLGALHQRWQLGAVAAVGAVIGWRRHRRLVVTGAAWVAGAIMAMAVTHPLWPHHAVAVSPGYALLCAAGISSFFGQLLDRARPSTTAATTLAVALVVGAALYLASGLRHLPAHDLSPLATRLANATSASGEVLGDEQFAQALANRASPPFFVDTSLTRLLAETGALQRLEAAADGHSPVCAVLFSSGRFASLPGFEAWVGNHYPVRLSLGPSQRVYLLPACG